MGVRDQRFEHRGVIWVGISIPDKYPQFLEQVNALAAEMLGSNATVEIASLVDWTPLYKDEEKPE